MEASVRWLYDEVEERLFRERDGAREQLQLSPQQHRLVSFMADRNRLAGDGKPVLCTREELIAAVWGDEPDHGPQDLAYLIHQLRTRLGEAPDDPPLMVNERGRGYRLMLARLERHPPVATPPQRKPERLRVAIAAIGAGVALAAILAWTLFGRPQEPILREGSRGEDVLALQRELRDIGYDPVYLDGQYGPLTAKAVRAFQQDHGLVVDNEVGPATRAALRSAHDAQSPATGTQ